MDDEMVLVLTEEDEINELAREINGDPENHKEEYKKLLETIYTNANARKLHFETLLRLRHVNSGLWDKTLNVICSYLSDPEPEVRKVVAKNILQLCKGGNNVSQVSITLAQLIAQHVEGSSVAEDSLRKLIREHPAEAITSTYCAFNVLECNCHKLTLLKYLDTEISKMGTIGDAMRKKIYDIFFEMLADPDVNRSIEDIKKVFFCAVDSYFFPNTVDRIQLVNRSQLNLSFQNNDEIVEMYRTALSLVGWIDDKCDFAWIVVQNFLRELCDDQNSNNINLTLGKREVREICKVIVELTRKTRKFLFLPDEAEVEESQYITLFNLLLQICPDPKGQLLEELELDLDFDLKDLDILFIEAIAVLLYNLMPEMSANHALRDQGQRKKWVGSFHYLVNALRITTDKWKSELNDENCANRENKESLLHASANIGIIMMDFMKAVPKRTHSIIPSWIPNWRPPRLVASVQSGDGNNQSEAPRFAKRGAPAAAPRPSGRPFGKRRASNVPPVNTRKRNRR